MVKFEAPVVTGSQIRAARALLDVTAAKLASETLVEVKTIRRAEARNHEPVLMTAANTMRIVAALEAWGVEFIPANGGGPGVRLAKNPAELPRPA